MMIVLLALKPVAETGYTRRLGLVALGLFTALMAYHTVHYARIAAAQLPPVTGRPGQGHLLDRAGHP